MCRDARSRSRTHAGGEKTSSTGRRGRGRSRSAHRRRRASRGRCYCMLFALWVGAMPALAPDGAMRPTYAELAKHLLDLKPNGRPHWVCVAGGPGSGKSTLGAAVADLVNEQCGEERAVVLPMDGFHYSRAELRGTRAWSQIHTCGPCEMSTWHMMILFTLCFAARDCLRFGGQGGTGARHVPEATWIAVDL